MRSDDHRLARSLESAGKGSDCGGAFVALAIGMGFLIR